jgi:hypothetical protein
MILNCQSSKIHYIQEINISKVLFYQYSTPRLLKIDYKILLYLPEPEIMKDSGRNQVSFRHKSDWDYDKKQQPIALRRLKD